MKKRILKYRFNMIEVMLAIVIIAVGMATTFVLFPVGLNTNKQAMAENNICDLAEYVTAFVRAESQDSTHLDYSGTNPTYAFKNIATNYRSASKVFSSSDFNDAIDVENPPSADWESGSDPNNILMPHKSLKGVYLIRQLSGSSSNRIVDFSALAQVYLDTGSGNTSGYDNEYFPAAKPTASEPQKLYKELPNKSKSSFNIQKFLLPLVLEISWPADVPADAREKRYFRFELFNGQYTPTSDSRTP